MSRITLLLALTLTACNGPSSADVAPVTTTTPASAEPVLAVALDITKVSIYQGVEIVLFEESGLVPDFQAPVIRKRPAKLRVFVDPKGAWVKRDVIAVLEIEDNNGTTEIVNERVIKRASEDSEMNTTINFDIPGDLIGLNTKFHVNIYEADTSQVWDGNEGNVTWNSGKLDSDKTGEINLVILPVKYNADGSGRLPDTSQAQLDRIHDLMMGMYPATAVNVTVGGTITWNNSVRASGNGWSSLLDQVSDFRHADRNAVPENTYYYGLFNPDTSLSSYCSMGCVLGLSNLSWNTTTPWMRSSIGLGFTGDDTAETLAHEVGHAHGREHAPCGLGNQSSDSSYPYGNARLGTWGYHIIKDELYNPNDRFDIMSYCGPTWVSDYQYYSLYVRVKNLAEQGRAATIPYQTIRVDQDGNARLSKVREFTPDRVGEYVDVTLLDAFGAPIEVVEGEFIPLSHLDGGMVRIPPVGKEVRGVRVAKLER